MKSLDIFSNLTSWAFSLVIQYSFRNNSILLKNWSSRIPKSWIVRRQKCKCWDADKISVYKKKLSYFSRVRQLFQLFPENQTSLTKVIQKVSKFGIFRHQNRFTTYFRISFWVVLWDIKNRSDILLSLPLLYFWKSLKKWQKKKSFLVRMKMPVTPTFLSSDIQGQAWPWKHQPSKTDREK